ncbi:MAG TPA: hypothetical protein ENI23_00760 [bacterium]|nr:hypothetical protein [bacterium]
MVEILLVVAIMVALGGLSVVASQAFSNRDSLDTASNILVQTIRRAQILSQSVDGDSTWGVYVDSQNVVLFQGATYATRDAAFDELFELDGNLFASGMSEIVFDRFTGEPQTTGTMTLGTTLGENKNIVINSKGMIEY